MVLCDWAGLRCPAPPYAFAPPSSRSGSLAIFTAMRRASSRDSGFMDIWRCGSSSKMMCASAWPVESVTTKNPGCSSIDQGGGKRRRSLMADIRRGPLCTEPPKSDRMAATLRPQPILPHSARRQRRLAPYVRRRPGLNRRRMDDERRRAPHRVCPVTNIRHKPSLGCPRLSTNRGGGNGGGGNGIR